jgi:hypothetical protein
LIAILPFHVRYQKHTFAGFGLCFAQVRASRAAETATMLGHIAIRKVDLPQN